MILAVLPAVAAPLAVHWVLEPGQPVGWTVTSTLHTPHGARFLLPDNQGIALKTLTLTTALSCEVADATVGWALTCGVAASELSGEGWTKRDARRVEGSLQALDGMLDAVRLSFVLHPEGRVQEVDVDGALHRDRRSGRVREQLRQLMRRQLAALELSPPERVEEGATWRQTGSPLMCALPSFLGPAIAGTGPGSTEGCAMEHTLRSVQDEQFTITTRGRGAAAFPGEVPTFVTWHIEGDAVFDNAAGTLRSRSVTAKAEVTASSMPFYGPVVLEQTSVVRRE